MYGTSCWLHMNDAGPHAFLGSRTCMWVMRVQMQCGLGAAMGARGGGIQPSCRLRLIDLCAASGCWLKHGCPAALFLH